MTGWFKYPAHRSAYQCDYGTLLYAHMSGEVLRLNKGYSLKPMRLWAGELWLHTESPERSHLRLVYIQHRNAKDCMAELDRIVADLKGATT